MYLKAILLDIYQNSHHKIYIVIVENAHFVLSKHLYSIYYVPSTILTTLQILTYLHNDTMK